MPTRAALQHRAPTVSDAVGIARRAAPASESAGPALVVERVDAKGLAALARHELGNRQAALESNGIAGHGGLHKLDGGTLRLDWLMGLATCAS